MLRGTVDDFLGIAPSLYVAHNALCFAIRDRFPVSLGHTLVITRRRVATWFDATADEQRALFALVDEVKAALDAEHHPDGYNVGFNAGAAAGQTVMHLHVHVIPRYRGDMPDPRGGVRHVIPEKGNYLKSEAAPQPPPLPPLNADARPLSTGGDDPFLRHLHPLWRRAEQVAIVAAFVRDSGLQVLRRELLPALERGARVQLLTGDYLNITQAQALAQLLSWQRGRDDQNDDDEYAAPPVNGGALEVRVVDTQADAQRRRGETRSFHPKSWRFEGPGLATAFVGSSNISKEALMRGVEWNLRVERERDPAAYGAVVAAFQSLWSTATVLDQAWLDAYAARPATVDLFLPEDGPVGAPPPPHPLQQAALAALAAARAEGRTRALVVLATGLGKTWLAVYDVAAFAAARAAAGAAPPRVLVLAHQELLLRQAEGAFRALFATDPPGFAANPRLSRFVAGRGDLDADLVFASVQRLSRARHLQALAGRRFDYVIVDEAHHAHAESYRAVLARLSGAFLLGLTATPERADLGDIGELFGPPLFRAGLGTGIDRGLLAPFAYYGVADRVDWRALPFRDGDFAPDALDAALRSEARMGPLHDALALHPGKRTIFFCASIAHADFLRGWLAGRAVSAAAIHSGVEGADPDDALARLAQGELDAVCAVDMLNEGVDVPAIDRVVLLRPSESSVVFLQQLGRGLRKAPGKAQLTVLDFVGNHQVFLRRLGGLVASCSSDGGAHPQALRAVLQRGQLDLPGGSQITLELSAQRVLRALLPEGASAALALLREQQVLRGRRPTAREFHLLGLGLTALYRGAYGDARWFDVLRGEGMLDAAERAALAEPRTQAWLRSLETTELSRSFKLILLRALIAADALFTGLPVARLAELSLEELKKVPALWPELTETRALAGLDLTRGVTPAFVAHWRRNPVQAWGGPGGAGKEWFELRDDVLRSRIPAGDAPETLKALTAELIDYRLADYLARDEFLCEVVLPRGIPTLRLRKDKGRTRRLPAGEVTVRLLPDAPWRFTLHERGCSAARPAGRGRDRLADLLRAWFGALRGGEQVRLCRGDEWTAEAIDGRPLRLPLPQALPTYPSLRAAAGALGGEAQAPPAMTLRSFATDAEVEGGVVVRVHGASMDGGKDPLPDGTYVLLRPAGAEPAAFVGQVVLVAVHDDEGDDARYLLKALVREGDRLRLRAQNPAFADLALSPAVRVVGVVVERLRPALEEAGAELGPTGH